MQFNCKGSQDYKTKPEKVSLRKNSRVFASQKGRCVPVNTEIRSTLEEFASFTSENLSPSSRCLQKFNKRRGQQCLLLSQFKKTPFIILIKGLLSV